MAMFKNSLVFALALVLVFFYIPQLSADENQPNSNDVIDMVVGDIQTVTVNNLTRVSVTNPEVADISDAQGDKVSVLAKKAGGTILFLWDADGKRTVKVRVTGEDLNTVKTRVQKVLDEANISGVSLEPNLDIGKVVISGSLSKDEKNRLEDILQPYSENLLDLVKEDKNEELVQVDMQIVEISTSLEKDIGIQWGTSGTSAGGINNPTFGSGTTLNQQISYGEGNIPTGGGAASLFKIGQFARTTPLKAQVNALVQEGKARLISKPRLVVVNGKQASFLVGGEIPILSTTSSTTGGTIAQNTTYTQYGVNLTVTPTIREGKIDVVLNVDIRDIDASNSSNGNIAFTTRTASTDLFMDNKQTIALAGLIKYSDSVQVNKVPFLGDIPIVGLLFRNRQTPSPDTNTEMVIVITPTVLTNKKFTDREVEMPTPEERSAWKEVITSKYPHEPLPDWPVSKTTPVAYDRPAPPLSEITAYARTVQEKISLAISYLESDLGEIDLAGTVKLKLHILKDGSLDSEEIVESSGNDILDQDAMRAAKIAAPYDAFTTGIQQGDLIFTVPIVYNKSILGRAAPTERALDTY